MLEHVQLTEQFNALLTKQQQAARIYADLASKLPDPNIRKQVDQLLRDKQRHIQLTQRMLEIVQ